MKTLILVRHAHALNGFEARVNTDAARPLSETGRQQAAASADTLQKQKVQPDIIFTSPFLRAVQTAEIFSARLRAPVQTETLLNGFSSDEEVISFLGEQLAKHNTVLAVSAEDLSFAKELDGIAQGVSGRAADKAPSEPVLIPHCGTPSKTV